jgi:uncharacterized protein YndB with AHSA1/START domain
VGSVVSASIELCTEIPASPAEVWAVVEQIHTHPRWMADAERITFIGTQMQGVGTEFDCRTVIGPLRVTDRMRVTEWEPEVAMGIEHRGAVSGRGRFTLTPTSHGTEFCWGEVLTFPWWMGGGAGELAAKPVFERVWRANLARLRALVIGELSDR